MTNFMFVPQTQQERQQADAQALQQGLQAMSLHQQTSHGLQAMDPFAMSTFSGANSRNASPVKLA